MGNRALVVYEEPTDLFENDTQRYTLHYSHWGAVDHRLVDDISATTPFGSDDVPERELLRAMATALNDGMRQHEEFDDDDNSVRVAADALENDTDVDTEPIATGVTMEEICTEHVDYSRHNALFIVDGTWSVEQWVPVSCGFLPDNTLGENGVLFASKEYDKQGERFKNEVSGMKTILGRQVDAGIFELDEARAMLQNSVVKAVIQPDRKLHEASPVWNDEYEIRYPAATGYPEKSQRPVGHRQINDPDTESWVAKGEKPWKNAFDCVKTRMEHYS